MNRLRRFGIACVLVVASTAVGTLSIAPHTWAAPTKNVIEADLLDINTATAEQLKALPGIGEVYAEKIIKGRPYARKDELVQKNILSRNKYEGIKYKIVAKQK